MKEKNTLVTLEVVCFQMLDFFSILSRLSQSTERNTNDVTVAKKSRLDDSTGTKYVEKIGGLKNSSSSESSTSSSSTSKSKRADYNWLGKAIAERDAEEKPEDDPQQCATQ